jgi:hypothetical protein
MPLTREFRETVHARAKQDPAYRRALLSGGLECLLDGDLDTGKSVLRDYINATVGFEELGALVGKPPKSLMRMLSSNGNPRARNLLAIIAKLQELEGVRFGVRAAG